MAQWWELLISSGAGLAGGLGAATLTSATAWRSAQAAERAAAEERRRQRAHADRRGTYLAVVEAHNKWASAAHAHQRAVRGLLTLLKPGITADDLPFPARALAMFPAHNPPYGEMNQEIFAGSALLCNPETDERRAVGYTIEMGVQAGLVMESLKELTAQLPLLQLIAPASVFATLPALLKALPAYDIDDKAGAFKDFLFAVRADLDVNEGEPKPVRPARD